VRQVAAGQFTQRIPTEGDEREFAELAVEFNRMAEELDGLYRSLEDKVIAKSKELLRSERLASVGFLAAGVAHEINNPLNIISGYAELSLKQLRRAEHSTPPSEDAAQALQIIYEEAFRCKQITEKLLSLAKPGSGNRVPVSLAHVAEEIRMMVRGLKDYGDRSLRLEFDAEDEARRNLTVLADETQMKQVVLNLTINALQSTRPGVGEVVIGGSRNDGWVSLYVQDNGCGMTQDVLDRIFAPFFSAKSEGAAAHRGVGLGMSITHAIIEDHGGRIRVQSDGPGKGSRFVIQLPAHTAAATTTTTRTNANIDDNHGESQHEQRRVAAAPTR
jgi:signal transduction histidine kinase